MTNIPAERLTILWLRLLSKVHALLPNWTSYLLHFMQHILIIKFFVILYKMPYNEMTNKITF